MFSDPVAQMAEEDQAGEDRADKEKPTMDRDTMPFVAPCRILSPFAPFGWIRKGVADLHYAVCPA
jgi:hypothetical protein